MNGTQPISIPVGRIERYLENNYHKKVQLYPLSNYHHENGMVQVIDQTNQQDSFRSIHFPSIKRGLTIFMPQVSLQGLDKHLKSQGKVVEGPEVKFPSLLAQAKYAEFDFEESTKGHHWRLNYESSFSDSNPLSLTVEGGWSNLGCSSRFSFTTQVETNSSIYDLFNQTISTCGMGNSWKTFSQTFSDALADSKDDLLLCIATCAQDDPFLGPKSNWKRLESMGIEEFTDLVWRCIVQKRSLRTAIMKETEFEALEKVAKKKRVEGKKNGQLDTQTNQEETSVEKVTSKNGENIQFKNEERVTFKRPEAPRRESSSTSRCDPGAFNDASLDSSAEEQENKFWAKQWRGQIVF